jgi:hypothetical protein
MLFLAEEGFDEFEELLVISLLVQRRYTPLMTAGYTQMTQRFSYEKGWLQVTRGAITKTCEELGPHFNNLNNQTVSCFIDWNCLETHVVIHGAVAFYNDWKSMNGLKHQAVETAFGMVVNIWDIIIAEK